MPPQKTSRGGVTRIVLAAVAASALCLVLATRVFVSFDGRRVKLVKTPVPAVSGKVVVETITDARAAALAAPVAVIVTLRNSGATPERISIQVDGHRVCEAEVAVSHSTRVDCVATVGWVARPDHVIEFFGQTSQWSLDFLEVATHHGSSTRALPFLVLPDVTSVYERPSLAALILTWLLLVALCVLTPVPLRQSAWWAHRVLSVVVGLVLAGMVISPWVSSFLVMMPRGAFARAVLVLLAPRLWRVYQSLSVFVPWVFRDRPRWRPIAAAAAVSVIVAAGYGAVVRHTAREFGGNYSGLLKVSQLGFDRSPLFTARADIRHTLVLEPNEGYDAQFMYFAAFDPLMRRLRSNPQQYRNVADAAPYRFGRIGFPWLVRAVAGDRWHWYPSVMVGLVLLGVVTSTFVIARLAEQAGASGLWGLVVLAFPGFWQSARVALPEPVAAAFLLLGYWCVVERRLVLAAVMLAASLLVRETGLVFLLAMVCLAPVRGLSWRQRVWLGCAVIPLICWRVYVAMGLWPDWGWQGLFYSSHSVALPFAGLVGLWSALVRGDYHPLVPELARAATWFPLLLLALGGLAVSLARVAGRFIGPLFVVYTLLALSLTHPTVWGHVGNGQRVSYEAFIMLALASIGSHRLHPHLRHAIIACWCAAALFILFGAHDASFIRDALVPW